MHLCTRRLGKPRFEILEQLGKALKHRIRRTGQPILPTFIRETRVHNKTCTTACSPLDRFRENAIDLTGVRLCTLHRTCAIRQKRLIHTIRMGPNLTRHKAIRAAQKLEVVVIKDVRLTLKIEL